MEDYRDSRLTGKKGEDAACLFLAGKGHSILERNWRSGHLEIDIISLDRNGIHFVEVKSRTLPAAVQPQESVNRTKQRKICEAARSYLNMMGSTLKGDYECHFDIIAILFAHHEIKGIEMFEDAFYPGL